MAGEGITHEQLQIELIFLQLLAESQCFLRMFSAQKFHRGFELDVNVLLMPFETLVARKAYQVVFNGSAKGMVYFQGSEFTASLQYFLLHRVSKPREGVVDGALVFVVFGSDAEFRV